MANSTTDPSVSHLKEPPEPPGEIVMPLIKDNRTLGTLTLHRSEGQCTEAERRLLSLLANYAAGLIDSAQLESHLSQTQRLESLGMFVVGIAHDFNNMLSGILGFTQLMLHQVEPGSKLSEGLRRIEALGQRAAEMVKQLLVFSRREAAQKASLSLHPFLKEIIHLLERMVPENIEIRLNLVPQDLTIEVDSTQLLQVLMNLVVNARDAMPTGGHIDLSTARVELDETFCQRHPGLVPGWYARLSVRDTGVGIAPEIQPRIFDPFFTTKEEGQGTGLGLAVVYGIVKHHDGAIEVESEPGQGATFHIYLPLTEQPAARREHLPVEAHPGTETILLVEDEPMLLELGQRTLERLGYRVLTAPDGVEAIKLYQAHRDEVALVVLDVVMPKLNGHEVYRELKRLDADVTVLMTTGYNNGPTTVESLLAEGVCGVVFKPYNIDELARAVRAALEAQSEWPGTGR
jgi:signal transduction histidine kinase/CheY-like chemotaxis protein